MGRKSRIQLENSWYHILNRAAGKKYIFSEIICKEYFLSLLSEIHTRYNVEIHSYCLMSNHYHLLIFSRQNNISDAIKYLQVMYTKFYNKLHQSDGPIFRGRYKSIFITSDSYILQLCKYIHLNPVKAKIKDGFYYPWSSFKYYISDEINLPNWLFLNYIKDLIGYDINFAGKFITFHEVELKETQIDFFKLISSDNKDYIL